MIERWKPISGFKGRYEISDFGRVRSLARKGVKRTRFLTPKPHPEGYIYISLSSHGVSKSYKVHRLVAQAFIKNPHNKLMVNHKNGIRNDNHYRNLEWVTNQENITHGYQVLGTTHKRVAYKKGKLKGVSFHKASGKFCAKIAWDGKELHLGIYVLKSEAYKVYHSKHLELHGFEPFSIQTIPEDA